MSIFWSSDTILIQMVILDRKRNDYAKSWLIISVTRCYNRPFTTWNRLVELQEKGVENERPESWKFQKSLKMFQVFLLIKKNIFWKWTSPKWTTSPTRIYKNKGGQKVKKLMVNFYITRNWATYWAVAVKQNSFYCYLYINNVIV